MVQDVSAGGLEGKHGPLALDTITNQVNIIKLECKRRPQPRRLLYLRYDFHQGPDSACSHTHTTAASPSSSPRKCWAVVKRVKEGEVTLPAAADFTLPESRLSPICQLVTWCVRFDQLAAWSWLLQLRIFQCDFGRLQRFRQIPQLERLLATKFGLKLLQVGRVADFAVLHNERAGQSGLIHPSTHPHFD